MRFVLCEVVALEGLRGDVGGADVDVHVDVEWSPTGSDFVGLRLGAERCGGLLKCELTRCHSRGKDMFIVVFWDDL